MSYHESESEARKWLKAWDYPFAFKLGNSEPADFLVLNRAPTYTVFMNNRRIEMPRIISKTRFGQGHAFLVEVKSVRASTWYLRGQAGQLKQFEALKKYSKESGIAAFYLVSLVKKHKRVWRFVSLAEVEEKGKVEA